MEWTEPAGEHTAAGAGKFSKLYWAASGVSRALFRNGTRKRSTYKQNNPNLLVGRDAKPGSGRRGMGSQRG